MKITSCTIARGQPPHTSYLWPCFVYLPPHRCSPFISCSGIPVKASLWLVSWTMMDTGGQRKCPHGWDQSTVLGLWQWPWRLIISPQKCSFMLLISCKLVSGFSSPPLSREKKKKKSQRRWVRWESYVSFFCCPHVYVRDLNWRASGGSFMR